MKEAEAVRVRDKVAKAVGLTSTKANVVLRGGDDSREVVVLCVDERIRHDCQKLLPERMDGLPVKVMLRPTAGSTPGLRMNTAHGRVVLRDK